MSKKKDNLITIYKAAVIGSVIANSFRSLLADKNKPKVEEAILICEEQYTDFDSIWEGEGQA